MKTTAIYPGTFDPLTNGHLDIIERASRMFSSVIVTVAKNYSKTPMFTAEQRVEMISACVKQFRNVRVEIFEGLLVAYAKKKKATVIVRGVRAVSDFEYEFRMALANRKLEESVSTVFLMPDERYSFISSSLVREIASLGGDVSGFVPPFVLQKIKKKFT